MTNIRSDNDVKQLPLKAKPYKKSIGGSLFVYVMPGGAKYWRMSYRLKGKQSTLSFGVFPDITLADAIRLRDEAKKMLSQGRDATKEMRAARGKTKLKKTRAVFQYSVSSDGELSITSGRSTVCLNREQSLALKAFMLGYGQ